MAEKMVRTEKEYSNEVMQTANELRGIINKKKINTGVLYGVLKLLTMELELNSKDGWRPAFESKQLDAALMQTFFSKEQLNAGKK